LALSSDGLTLYYGQCISRAGSSFRVLGIRLSDGAEVLSLSERPQAVYALAVSPDGKFLAAGLRRSGPDEVSLHQTTGGAEVARLTRQVAVSSLTFSPVSDSLVVAAGRAVLLWDFQTGVVQRRLRGHQGAAVGAAFSSGGRSLMTASQDGT